MTINSSDTNFYPEFSLTELAAHAVIEASKRLDKQKIPLSNEAKKRLHGVWIDIKTALSDTTIPQIMHTIEKDIIAHLEPQQQNIIDLTTKIENLWGQLTSRMGDSSLPIGINSCRSIHKQWENEALKYLWIAISEQINLRLNLLTIKDIEAWFENPENSETLKSIKKINLSRCVLRTLSPQLLKCSQLKKLILTKNQFTTLPEWFSNLGQLQFLDLSYNQTITFPESSGSRSQLQKVFSDYTRITTLPESFGNLSQLQKLYLNGNQLTILPESFGNLSQLQKLYLNENQLTRLPESFGNLSQLQILNLKNNKITVFPESFGDLSRLEYLDLSGNQITTLPESLGNFSQLKGLYLNGNKITTFPESLNNLNIYQKFQL